MASNVGVSISVNTAQMKTLSLALRRAPVAVRRAALAALRAQMKVVMADASERASYSQRIPGSMKITGSGLRIKGIAGGDNAPDAAAIENKGKGFVRHPVFGNRNVWTSKNSHPAYLAPALEAHREEVIEVMTDAVYAEVLKSLREY